jgi:hypothetical protein
VPPPNVVFGLGDVVVRVPRDHPIHVSHAEGEARTIPHGRDAPTLLGGKSIATMWSERLH